MPKDKEVFVGREKELQHFFDCLEEKKSLTCAIIGEPGIGKSSFLREIVKRIKMKSETGGVFVGFHEVLDGTTNVASPFVRVLDDLMANLSVPVKEKTGAEAKRVLSVAKKIFSEKGRSLAKSMFTSFATKYLGREIVDELKNAYEEWKNTPNIESLEEELFLKHRDEFVYDFLFFLKKLVEEYENAEFVLVVDQFERAPLISCKILLGLVRAKPERMHIVFSFKVEKEGAAKYASIKSELLQLNAHVLSPSPLSAEETGEWIKRARGRAFSYPELRKIRKLSGGFPYLIDNWLKYSKNLEPDELSVGREGYCQFIEWCFERLSEKCLLFIRKISVLLQPLSIGDYEKLTGAKTGECSLLLEEAERSWILSRQKGTFWFRHDLIKPCIEWKLSVSERNEYHFNAAVFFESKFNSSVKADEKVEFHVGLGRAYHFHNSGEYEKSSEYNLRFGRFCYATGSLDIAEDCYLRAIEAARKLNDEDSIMTTKGDLANVYRVWGRLDEASKINQELLEYFGKKQDLVKQAMALHGLALIEHRRGNYDKATELYRQSLGVYQELGDKEGLSVSLHSIARIERSRGNYDKATELYRQSLETYQELENTRGISYTLHELAVVYQCKGDYEKAIKFHLAGFKIDLESGDKSSVAKSLHQLGTIEHERGNYDKATELYRQSLGVYQELGDKEGISAIILQLGTIEYERGNYDKATELYRQSLALKHELGDKEGIAIAMYNFGILFAEKKQFEEALRHFIEAAFLFHQLGTPDEEQALESIERIAQKLRPAQFSKIMKGLSDDTKAYLKNMQV